MTVDERDEAIASFIDATREIVEAGRVMESTLSAIRRELARSDGDKAREEIAALHVEAARFAARAAKAEKEVGRLWELLLEARAIIASRETQLRTLAAEHLEERLAIKARAVNDGQKKRGTVEAVLEIAARLDRAADAKAAALIANGGVASVASVVYELRAFAAELRQLAEAEP